MKIIKNRTVIAGLCFLTAALIAFAVLPRFYADRKATATVYRAAATIPKGTLIEETHLSAVETGAFNLPDAVITDPNEIVGQIALTDIPQDDMFMEEKLGPFLHSERMDILMKNGQKLVIVTLSGTAAGVAGHLVPGDVVSAVSFIEAHEIYETDSETGLEKRINIPSETIIYPELRSISVFDIENAKTESMEDAHSEESGTSDPVPKTVTLIVTEEQALKLVEAEYSEKIHLIFERRNG